MRAHSKSRRKQAMETKTHEWIEKGGKQSLSSLDLEFEVGFEVVEFFIVAHQSLVSFFDAMTASKMRINKPRTSLFLLSCCRTPFKPSTVKKESNFLKAVSTSPRIFLFRPTTTGICCRGTQTKRRHCACLRASQSLRWHLQAHEYGGKRGKGTPQRGASSANRKRER